MNEIESFINVILNSRLVGILLFLLTMLIIYKFVRLALKYVIATRPE